MKRIIRKDVKLKDKDNKLYNITRTTPVNNEETFNNSSKYITKFPNTSLLEEFPEYLNGYNNVIATNTGLMCFYKDEDLTVDDSGNSIAKKLIIYDILASDNTVISSINPDIAPMLDYNHITNPLNVRHLNFSEGKFLPDREYYNGDDRYILINCDRINGAKNIDNNNANGYFQYGDIKTKTNPISVEFNYKPMLVLRIFDNNGAAYTTDISSGITSMEDAKVKKVKTGIYYMDCSTVSTAKYISISAPFGSGYMEVL